MKNIVLIACVFMACDYSAYSQLKSETTKKNQPSFGFNVGLNQSVISSSNTENQFEIQNAPGFRLGILADFSLSEKWSVSPKAELSFNYGSIIEDNTTYKVDPQNLDFMAHFKYRIKKIDKKLNPYFSFGPNVRVPLNGEFEGAYYDTKVALAADFAFGFDITLESFIISPEIRFSGGLTDIRQNPTGQVLRGSNAMFVINFSSK